MIKAIIKFKSIFIGIFLLLLLAGMFFVNLLYTKNYDGGKFFITQWTVSRAVITEHANPYTESILYKAQLNAYGRPAMADEYEFRFTYPFFSLLIFLPFGLISNYAMARAAWMLFLEIILVFMYFLNLNLANWNPKISIKLLIFIFMATFFYSIKAIVDGNLIIIITIFLVGILLGFRNRNPQISGILLAGLFLEIQYTFLILIVLLSYSLIKRNYEVIRYFLGASIVLFGFSFLFQPDWLTGYFQQLLLSSKSGVPDNFIQAMNVMWGVTGLRLGITIGIIMVIVIFSEVLRSRNKGFGYFLWLIYVVILASQWSGLPAISDNLLLLIPGFIYSLKLISERWKNTGDFYVFAVILSLSIISWISFFITREQKIAFNEPSIFLFVFPIFCFVIFYWARWWLIRRSDFKVNQW